MNMNISHEITGRGAQLGVATLALLLCAALLALAAPATSVAQTGPDGRVAEAGADRLDPTAHQYADRVTEVERDPEEGLPARVAQTLPVTGMDLLVLAGIAGLLVASGTMLRRLATPRE